jgi:hypothetical protein
LKSHVFRGKKYKISLRKRMEKADGECDSPDAVRKTIRLSTSARPDRQLTVAVHEALHACLWDLSEDAIASTAESIGSFLWRLGYRQDGSGEQKDT